MEKYDRFKRIMENYRYASQMAAGGFMINGKPALTQINPELIGDYVIMVVRDPLLDYQGDPAEILSKRLDNRILAGHSGMFTTYSGYYKGAHVSIVSGGSGGSEAELILVEFMQHTKANAFLRLGGGMGINENIKSGDVVIASGVVRDEGMTRQYVEAGFPAASSYEMICAFAQAAQVLDYRHHIGIGRSGDSEYVQIGVPAAGGYIQQQHTEIIDYYNRAGVYYCDRESSAIITLASLFGKRGCAVISVDNNKITGERFTAGDGQEHAADIVFEGLSVLHEMDEAKKNAGKKYWFPCLQLSCH